MSFHVVNRLSIDIPDRLAQWSSKGGQTKRILNVLLISYRGEGGKIGIDVVVALLKQNWECSLSNVEGEGQLPPCHPVSTPL